MSVKTKFTSFLSAAASVFGKAAGLFTIKQAELSRPKPKDLKPAFADGGSSRRQRGEAAEVKLPGEDVRGRYERRAAKGWLTKQSPDGMVSRYFAKRGFRSMRHVAA